MKDTTKRMVKKYGKEKCVEAYLLHLSGDGAYTIGYGFGVHTNTADGMINAGRDIEDERQIRIM